MCLTVLLLAFGLVKGEVKVTQGRPFGDLRAGPFDKVSTGLLALGCCAAVIAIGPILSAWLWKARRKKKSAWTTERIALGALTTTPEPDHLRCALLLRAGRPAPVMGGAG